MAKTGFGEHDLSAYALVADRITLFYQRYPAGRIVTELVSRTGREITFRALVFRGPAGEAAAWAGQRTRKLQVHLSEQGQHLPARHAGQEPVLTDAAQLQSWLHPSRAAA